MSLYMENNQIAIFQIIGCIQQHLDPKKIPKYIALQLASTIGQHLLSGLRIVKLFKA